MDEFLCKLWKIGGIYFLVITISKYLFACPIFKNKKGKGKEEEEEEKRGEKLKKYFSHDLMEPV